jgi:signal transduction histidine kinase/DNA-binding response OmpR family regulator
VWGYLNLYQPDHNHFIRYPGPKALSIDMYEDKNGVIWIGTFLSGLFAFHPDTGELTHFSEPGKANALMANSVWQFFKDVDASVYLVTSAGLYKMISSEITDSTRFVQHSHFNENIYWIFLDAQGIYWLVFSNGKVVGMESLEGPISKKFQHIYSPNKIFEDNYNRLWMTSGRAIYIIDAKRKIIKELGKSHSISYAQVGRFGEMLDDGTLLTTGKESVFHIIHTDDLLDNEVAPQIALKSIYSLKDKSPLSVGEQAGPLQLKKSQSSFAIEYIGLHYTQPKQIKYSYRLAGRDEDWIDIGNERTVRFPDLAAGQYTFLLKATNPDGYTTPEPLAIPLTVLPYWWASQWAYIAYFLLATGFIYWLYRLQRQRWRMRLQMEYNDKENQRLQEVYEMKSNLYTNITHEFRTPLAIILGMAKQVQKAPEKWFREGMGMIQHNSKLLLELVNQMLDMAKIQTGNLQANMIQADIAALLKDIYTSFQLTAGEKNKPLQFSIALAFHELYMDIDPSLFRQIMTNLLSNAIKFTPANGKIRLEAIAHEKTLIVKVIDTGIGIAPKDLGQIFDRFFQVDRSSTRKYEGTGIGLALVKKWVELLNGQITVKSELNKGSTFILLLPITHLATIASPEQLQTSFSRVNGLKAQNLESQPVADEEKPELLIVEDNVYFTQYLKGTLEPFYTIHTAKDGQEGIEKALQSIPDIILTDVMMPKKDGFELCQALKANEKTNHIPIIMLTAKADITSRVDGLAKGADAYLSKPFEEAELLVRLQKLLELRAVLQEKYQKVLPVSATPDDNIPATDPFLEKLHNTISNHLEDELFDINALSRKLDLDRTQLYRKVKALTGKAPVEIIRAIKMQYAQSMLLHTELSISEIAYKLGFKDPAYFSRLFKKEMGKSPKDFREA